MLKLTELKNWTHLKTEVNVGTTNSKEIVEYLFMEPSEPVLSEIQKLPPLKGEVSFRQALFTRKRLKETKGQSLVISKFHWMLDGMTVTDERLKQFVHFLIRLRSESYEKE